MQKNLCNDTQSFLNKEKFEKFDYKESLMENFLIL